MSDLDQPDPSGTAPGSQRSVHRSIFFSAIERYGNLVLFLVTTAVLARLLAPAPPPPDDPGAGRRRRDRRADRG